MRDFYMILGVSKNASIKEIRQAYRQLARRYHPDVSSHKDKSEAEKRFKEITSAYEVLSRQDNRAKYDRYGENWRYADQIKQAQETQSRTPFSSVHFGGFGVPFGFGEPSAKDQFNTLHPNMGRDFRHRSVRLVVEVSLAEAFRGTTREMETPMKNSGNSQRLEVTIPPGVDNGSTVHIPASKNRLQELYLEIRVRSDPRFERKGRDLFSEVPVPLLDAVLGGEVTVPTPTGNVALKLQPETQNGQTYRLASKGMPDLNARGYTGDLLVTVNVILPTGLTDKERELYLSLREQLSN